MCDGTHAGQLFSDFTCQSTNKPARAKKDAIPRLRRPFWDKEYSKKAERESYRWQPAEAIETVFRHGEWLEDRRRVLAALRASGCPASRIDRFDGCGSDCIVEFSPEHKRHRVRANFCGDRFCVPCCRARAAKARAKLVTACEGRRPLFITLPIRSKPQSLNDALDHLLKSFEKLRRCRLWKKHVEGGAYVVELKRGERSGEWHPHIHAVCVGSFMPQADLSAAWHRATGDSFIVDISRARDDKRAVGYISKYITKGWSDEILKVFDDVVECICALRGRRLLGTWGCFRRLDLGDQLLDSGRWIKVGRLSAIVVAAHAGEEWARGVFRSLGRSEWIEKNRHDDRDSDDG